MKSYTWNGFADMLKVNDANRNLEKALQALQQAKQRVANEKKKQNEKKRKAENHHKYIMGRIIVKYFPDCYRYDEEELNRILSVALQTRECQQIISKIKAESRETTLPQATIPNVENESEGVSMTFRVGDMGGLRLNEEETVILLSNLLDNAPSMNA